MHAVIIDDLEQFLSGRLRASALDRFRAHLESCGRCRREVHEMQQAKNLFASLKTDEALEPSPGFAGQVMENVTAQPAPSIWSIFGDFAFERRVAFASLLTMAVLGTVLVAREQAYEPAPPTPAAVMAADRGSPNADQMLVTLANYEP